MSESLKSETNETVTTLIQSSDWFDILFWPRHGTRGGAWHYQYRAGAGFTRQGFHVEYAYQYRNAHNTFKQDILQGHAGNAFLANDRDGETSTHNHNAKMTQSFRPAKGQQLTVGVDWVRNSIGQEHLLNVSSEGGSHKYTPRFDHRYQTQSAFMEYRYAYASVKAMARLEYAYTHMRYEGVKIGYKL